MTGDRIFTSSWETLRRKIESCPITTQELFLLYSPGSKTVVTSGIKIEIKDYIPVWIGDERTLHPTIRKRMYALAQDAINGHISEYSSQPSRVRITCNNNKNYRVSSRDPTNNRHEFRRSIV